MAMPIFTAGLPGDPDTSGTFPQTSPSPIRYMDYAQQSVYVDTPETLSRRETDEKYPPPSASSGQWHDTAPSSNVPAASRRWTQEDQDKQDEEAKNKAIKELVSSWMDRLQLISVITTFFAAIEAQLLGTVTPSSDPNGVTGINQASAATLSSALVVHSFAAMLSFVAAFFLVRFRVHEASKQEVQVEKQLEAGPAPRSSGDQKPRQASQAPAPPQVWSSNPRLEQVGPLRRGNPPTHLLESFHTLCMALSVIGFVLAMVGIMCYVWALMPTSSIVLSTGVIGLSIIASVVVLFLPHNFSLLSPSHVIEPS